MARVNGTLTGTTRATGPPVGPAVLSHPIGKRQGATIRTLTFGSIASLTVVYTPLLQGPIAPPFIASVTSVYAPTLPSIGAIPFISSNTIVYRPRLLIAFEGSGVSQVTLELVMPYNTDTFIGGRS